jgi:hypothetical protein
MVTTDPENIHREHGSRAQEGLRYLLWRAIGILEAEAAAESDSTGAHQASAAASTSTTTPTPKAPPPAHPITAAAKAPAPRPHAKASAPRPEIRFYVIHSWKRHPTYTGIYRGLWGQLESSVLCGRLAGSGASLRGFNTESEARTFWTSKVPSEPNTQGPW